MPYGLQHTHTPSEIRHKEINQLVYICACYVRYVSLTIVMSDVPADERVNKLKRAAAEFWTERKLRLSVQAVQKCQSCKQSEADLKLLHRDIACYKQSIAAWEKQIGKIKKKSSQGCKGCKQCEADLKRLHRDIGYYKQSIAAWEKQIGKIKKKSSQGCKGCKKCKAKNAKHKSLIEGADSSQGVNLSKRKKKILVVDLTKE